MATANIKLTDDGAGQVNVVIEFGEEGAHGDSDAHRMAVAMVRCQLGGGPIDEEDE